MKRRFILSLLWLGALVLAIGLVEAYFLRTVELMGQRVPILTAASRLAAYQQLAQIYAPMVLLVGAAWFAKPLQPIANSQVEAYRFRLAVASTVLFNIVTLAMIGRGHLAPGDGDVLPALETAKQVALALAFIVAWPNVHYFGAKPPGAAA